jgi:hypothetical protein
MNDFPLRTKPSISRANLASDFPLKRNVSSNVRRSTLRVEDKIDQKEVKVLMTPTTPSYMILWLALFVITFNPLSSLMEKYSTPVKFTSEWNTWWNIAALQNLQYYEDGDPVVGMTTSLYDRMDVPSLNFFPWVRTGYHCTQNATTQEAALTIGNYVTDCTDFVDIASHIDFVECCAPSTTWLTVTVFHMFNTQFSVFVRLVILTTLIRSCYVCVDIRFALRCVGVWLFLAALSLLILYSSNVACLSSCSSPVDLELAHLDARLRFNYPMYKSFYAYQFSMFILFTWILYPMHLLCGFFRVPVFFK